MNEFGPLLQKNGDAKYLTQDQNAQLNAQAKRIKEAFTNTEMRNKKVYQQKEPAPFELPEIPDESSPIKPLEPKDIHDPIGTEEVFSGFISPDVYHLKKEFTNAVDKELSSTISEIKDLQFLINDQYKEAQVNYLLNLAAQ